MPVGYDKIIANQASVLDLPLYEGTGVTVHDVSKYHNHGSFLAAGEPAWFQLPSGKWVLVYDGVDDCLDCGADLSLDINGDLTLLAWVYFNNVVATGTVINKELAGNWNLPYDMHLEYTGTKYWFGFRHGGGGSIQYMASKLYGSTQQWLCMGVIRNMTTGRVHIFKNGHFSQINITIVPANLPAQRVLVGRKDDGTYPFPGMIGDARIFNRCFTNDEVKFYYNSTREKYGV